MRREMYGRAWRFIATLVSAVALAPALPAQQTTQYGPFRITAGRWHDIGLRLKPGESFRVVANGAMQRENVQFGAGGYQLQNGNIAGKLYALSGTSSFAVGLDGVGSAQVDGDLDLGVMFAPQIDESDARVTSGAFYAWVTAPAGRCPRLDCGFTNGTGSDLPGGTPGPGNVANWAPYMQGIATAGYQLGIAEVGAVNGPSNDANLRYVDERLRMAMSSAETGKMSGALMGQLITQLGQIRNTASIAPQITQVGDTYQQQLSRTCVCGGIQLNPAWVFNAGRNLAYAEAATYQNWNASVMYTYLMSYRTACINTRIVPVGGIDAVAQMLNNGWQPNNLPSSAREGMRNPLWTATDQSCVCY